MAEPTLITTSPIHHALQVTDVLLLFGCLFFTPLIVALTLFLSRRKNPLSQGPFAYAFDADGIHTTGPTFSVSLKWAAIQKIRESNSFLFFFVAPGRAHSMPLNQLQSAGILDGVRELSLQKVIDTRFRGAQQRAAGDARNART
jgi:YcxB-like protein